MRKQRSPLISLSTVKFGFVALTWLCVYACGSPSNDETGFDPLPQVNNPNVPQYQVPEVNNGYYLQTQTVSFGEDSAFREIEFSLDEQNRTISEFEVNYNGSRSLAVRYEYNAEGLIVKQEEVGPTGVVLQTFETSYDTRRRLVTESTLARDVKVFSADYRFNDVGAPFKKVVKLTVDDSEFSETTYQYDNDRRLVSSIFKSQLLPQEDRRTFRFSDDGSQLEVVEDWNGARVEFDYDQFGNRVLETIYNESGEVTFTSVLIYAAVEGKVPNLPLHRSAYEPDLLF